MEHRKAPHPHVANPIYNSNNRINNPTNVKTIDHNNLEEMLFLYREGLLEASQRQQVKEYVATHAEAQELLNLYDPQLTLPHSLPLTDVDGTPLHYPHKETLYSNAISARREPQPKQETPIVPLPAARRRYSLLRTLTAAACVAVLLALGIEMTLHTDSPAAYHGTTTAQLHHHSHLQRSTPLPSPSLSQPTVHHGSHETLPAQETVMAADHGTPARNNLQLDELQAIAASLQTSRHNAGIPTDAAIHVGETYTEDISSLLAEWQSEAQPNTFFDTPYDAIVVDNLVAYSDSLSFSARLWNTIVANNPELEALYARRGSRPQPDSILIAQQEQGILQRVAQRLGRKKKTNIKTEFNDLGNYLAQVGDLKRNSLKWIADGADTVSQRFNAFAKNTWQDERLAARRRK